MKDYITQAKRTEAPTENTCIDLGEMRLIHAVLGISSEAGELADAFKKWLFYGRELDEVNLREELGDLLWYIALALDELGTSFDEVMKQNIAKLRARYPEKFTEEHATIRDLEKERRALEGD